jgi:hypothetical protein
MNVYINKGKKLCRRKQAVPQENDGWQNKNETVVAVK